MPGVIAIGPLHLQSYILAILLAFAAGWWLIKLHIRNSIWASSPITDMLLTAGTIIPLTWKFGVVFSTPSLLWTNPLKLLMLSGGSTEVILGALIAFLYLAYQIRRHKLPALFFIDLLAYGGMAASIVYNLLVVQYGQRTSLPWGIGVEGTQTLFHPVNLYFALLLVPLILFLLVSRWRANNGQIAQITAIYYGCAGMLVTFFSVITPTALFLSPAQLMYIILIIAGMLLPNFTHNRDRKELIELAKNDSKEQIQQEQEDSKARQEQSMDTNGDGNFDKKLDGPNRPAE